MTKQQLIEDNMKLVYGLVSKEYPTYLYDEDIIQCGMLGLCEAAGNWEEGKLAFSTYATYRIRHRIQDEFRRRLKHQGILSLDYEIDDGEGGISTFGEIITGDEDVPYFDIGIDLSKLNEKERRIAELLSTSMTQADIAREIGVSRQYVWQTIRKIRAMRGYVNED